MSNEGTDVKSSRSTQLAAKVLAFLIIAIWSYLGLLVVVAVTANLFRGQSGTWMEPALNWFAVTIWPTFPVVGLVAVVASIFLRCPTCNAVIFPMLLNNGPARGRNVRMFRAVKAGLLGRDLECPQCHTSVFSDQRA